jgi:anti-sigma regulatory factor (Ser/Thr protein kinase)
MVDAGQDRRPAGPELSCWDGASAQSLAEALAPPTTICVEADAIGRRSGPVHCMASGRRLILTMTARSVYRHPIARVFAGALQDRLNLSSDLHERVHTALQEAMMNAMLHGNLGLGSGLRDSLQALAALRETIEAHFASESTARSMIRVEATWTRAMLRVVVTDSGGGFTRNEPRSPDERLATSPPGSGRGFMILETLCDHIDLRRGGSTIVLGFSLSKAQTRFQAANWVTA